MKLRKMRYFDDFHCIGGHCPDTCCRDWEVVLDEETAAFYRTVEGPLGREIRAAMTELDGEPCFFLRDGLCPMLNDQGLCRIQLELGEEHLSHSCDLHPRFAEEYGSLREWTLSLACPEAARLLLADSTPMTFVEEVTEEPVTSCNDLNPQLFFSLLTARKTALALVQDRSVPWQTRLGRLLSFGVSYQKALDQHRLGRLDSIADRYAAGRFPRMETGTQPDSAHASLSFLQQLEPINAHWPELLHRAVSVRPTEDDRRRFAEVTSPWDYGYEHLLVYYLFRYVLKAVVDRRLLPRLQLAAAGLLWVREMELSQFCTDSWSLETRIDLLHRFSREVEHSEENLRRLSELFAAEPALSPQALAAAAW